MAAIPQIDARVRQWYFAELQAATEEFRTQIGKGATGEVYHGVLDGALVAVKRLNLPAGSAPEVRAQLQRRFVSELRTLAATEHVRLVQLRGYAVDESPGTAHPFALVYELLEGGSVADWLRGVAGEAPARPQAGPPVGAGHASEAARCSLTALQRIEIALGVASGLVYLHGQEEPADPALGAAAAAAAGGAVAIGAGAGGAGAVPRAQQAVLHRDIKSANVGLAVLAGGALHAKLLDFGLARALAGPAAGGPAGAAAVGASLTSLGAGTPGYMAPELGNTGPSVQTEVYALGIVLLELLSGRRVDPATVSRLLEDAEEAGPAEGAFLIAAQAEAGVWPEPAATALSQLIVACTRLIARRRPVSVAIVIPRLRAVRALLAPAAPLVYHV